MSRIGKIPVDVPAGVKISSTDCKVVVEGPLGKLEWEHRPEVAIAIDDATRTQWSVTGHAIELNHTESEGYYLNLSSPQPKVFVMWRSAEAA